ncbi:MAG: uracil-DNA glycosylase [Puniceicoccales bacterium]|nr:uracil-DNA glycosylase [Puniceicoccales bacterium]
MDELKLLEAEGVKCVEDNAPLTISQPQHSRPRQVESLSMGVDNLQGTAADGASMNTLSSKQVSVPQITLPDGDKLSQWKYLQNLVFSCPICNSHTKPGKKIVFGVGNLDADIFFCGEAPGEEEEIRGEPFVGRAGQVLTKLIQAMGLQRSDVYIGNIMNWRPEMPTNYGNRPPTQQEMQLCMPYLMAQLKIVNPKVVIALGATAVHGLLGYDPSRRMGDVRGRWFSIGEIPLFITYHPSFILRSSVHNPMRTVWEDLMKVMEYLHIPIDNRNLWQNSSEANAAQQSEQNRSGHHFR